MIRDSDNWTYVGYRFLMEGGTQQVYEELLLPVVKSNMIALRSICLSVFQQTVPNQYRASLQNTQLISGVVFVGNQIVGNYVGNDSSFINYVNPTTVGFNGASIQAIPISSSFQWFGCVKVSGAESVLVAPFTTYGAICLFPVVHWDIAVVENFEVFVQVAYEEL